MKSLKTKIKSPERAFIGFLKIHTIELDLKLQIVHTRNLDLIL